MLVTWHGLIVCILLEIAIGVLTLNYKKIESGRRKSGVVVFGDDKKLIRDCLAVSKKARSTF